MRSLFKDGLHPSELWGIAARDMSKPHRTRGDAARARRAAKRKAKRMGVRLKWLLRSGQ
jgi:hypothetical protein